MLAVMPIGPGVAGYQDTVTYLVTTINPGGCASVRSEHSVAVMSQMSVRDHVNYNMNADATALNGKDHRARK